MPTPLDNSRPLVEADAKGGHAPVVAAGVLNRPVTEAEPLPVGLAESTVRRLIQELFALRLAVSQAFGLPLIDSATL